METGSDQPADNSNSESNGSTIDESQPSVPVVPDPSLPATIRVDFEITVPAVMSDQLQVRLNWGDITTTAAWVRDESWSISENFPANTENLLVVTFADRNGGTTLGTVESTLRTGTDESEIVQVSADQFDTERWDSDSDGVSNLDELIAGTNSDGNADGVPQPVQASLELVTDKTFRITWQSSSSTQFYRVVENADGVSGFTDISGELETTTNFDHRVALYFRVNAQYLVQSCNDQGCVDSDVLIVTGTLADAIGYFKASNTGSFDAFGVAISLSVDGNILAVGAPGDDSAATGINGEQHGNAAGGSGAVHVFVRSGVNWQQRAYIKSSNTGFEDSFGGAVSLSADGNTLAVGAVDEDSSATGFNGDQNNNSSAASGAVYLY